MGITNGYILLDDYKDRDHITDDQDDGIFESYIEAISRKIDELTWRRFYKVTETRTFTPEYHDTLFIFDLTAITTLKSDPDGDRTYPTEWASTDYDLLPENATIDGKPWTEIQIAPNGEQRFPVLRSGIQIAGDFGYVADQVEAPFLIKEAVHLGVNRIRERQATPLGVSASSALGELRVAVKALESDPDFMGMIESFVTGYD